MSPLGVTDSYSQRWLRRLSGTLLSVRQLSMRDDHNPLLFINLGLLYFVCNCATLFLELFIYCFTPHKEALWILIFPLHLMVL